MLEVKALDAFYGQSHVLHGIEFELRSGQRMAVLGRNGAGKSTLFKSLMSAGPTVRGEIRIDGVAVVPGRASDRAALGMAFVPEDRRIFDHLTVVDNLRLAQKAVPRVADKPGIEELLDRFPMLRPLRARLGSQMSGGQQQMLAVARAVAARPRLMLLDEPTEGLAPVIVEQLADEVVSCCEAYGIALLLAEQSIWFARKCTDRVLVIDTGRRVFAGDWAEFDAAKDVLHRYLAL